MSIPAQGFLRIYPGTVSLISGHFSVAGTGIGAPSATANLAQLQAYYGTRLDTPANAPRLKYASEVPALGGTWVPDAGTYELSFSPNTTRLLFDPSGVAQEIDFLSASFPMGLLLDQLRIHWNGSYTTGPSRNRQLTDISLKYFGTTYKQVTPTPGVTFNGDIESDVFAIIPFLAFWSPVQIFKVFGFSTTMATVVSVLLNQPSLRNDLLYLECEYNTSFFNLTSTADALPGNLVEISDANDRLDAFDEDLFKIYWDDSDGDANAYIPGWAGGVLIPRSHILTFTKSVIRFIIPTNLGIPYGGKRLMITGTGDGTSFVGEFPIANLNITLVDGSGLYKLTEDQPYDTYYNRATTPVTTVNLKIP